MGEEGEEKTLVGISCENPVLARFESMYAERRDRWGGLSMGGEDKRYLCHDRGKVITNVSRQSALCHQRRRVCKRPSDEPHCKKVEVAAYHPRS